MNVSYIAKELRFIFYRFRHIIIYTFIGFFSIILELIIRKFLISANFSGFTSTTVSISIGILIAFILNIKLNFFIKKNLLTKALFYYFLISLFSISLQFLLIKLQILNLVFFMTMKLKDLLYLVLYLYLLICFIKNFHLKILQN